ncbi:hypothetical protein D1007_32237 [Hordeum vulgare]|nr:hypothetical protein D1007_32237 [Hordeum vulgare]
MRSMRHLSMTEWSSFSHLTSLGHYVEQLLSISLLAGGSTHNVHELAHFWLELPSGSTAARRLAPQTPVSMLCPRQIAALLVLHAQRGNLRLFGSEGTSNVHWRRRSTHCRAPAEAEKKTMTPLI